MESEMTMSRSRNCWFLVESNPEASVKPNDIDSVPTFRKYHLVDPTNLVDHSLNRMAVGRMVLFKEKEAVIGGKIIMVGDDKTSMEKRLAQMTDRAKAIAAHSYYMVQYNVDRHKFVLRIVKKYMVSLPLDEESRPGEVLLKENGRPDQPATSLCGYKSEDCLRKNLLLMKARCFDTAFDETDNEITIVGHMWLLVQYTRNKNDIVYRIMSINDTVWQDDNIYTDVLAYFCDDHIVYRGIIVRKSIDRTDLENALVRIKSTCLASTFWKLDITDTDVTDEDPTGASLRESMILKRLMPQCQMQSVGFDNERLENAVKSIDKKLKSNASTLLQTLAAVESAGKIIRRRISQLRQ